jgi:hypothetical protein
METEVSRRSVLHAKVVCVQLYYPQILLAGIMLEIVGGALFAFGLASGAFMLV